MTDLTGELPPGFEELAPLLAEWGDLETQHERYQQRQRLPIERLQAYYDVVTPRLGAIFDHLDGFTYGQPLPCAEARLYRLVMAMSEVAQAIEIYGLPVFPHLPKGHSVAISGLSES